MAAFTSQSPYKPLSIGEISGKAQDFVFDPTVKLKYWIRTADALLKEGNIYEREQNDQQAYLLFMRYATLVVDKLPTHPEAQDSENKKILKGLSRGVVEVVQKLEVLKPKIKSRWEGWQKAQATLKPFDSASSTPRERDIQDIQSFEASDPAVAGNRATVTGADHPDLAVRVAHKEIRRRDAARRATRQAGISEEQEQERRAAGMWDDWEAELSRGKQGDEDEDMRTRIQGTSQAQIQNARYATDGAHDSTIRRSSKNDQRFTSSRTAKSAMPANNYSYPQVARSQPLQYEQPAATMMDGSAKPVKPPKITTDSWPLDARNGMNQFEIGASPMSDSLPPPKPGKHVEYWNSVTNGTSPASSSSTAPPRPAKLMKDAASSTPSPITPADEGPEKYTFKAAAYLENGTPLRTVFLPPTLRTEFLKIAASNTKANLETCGILCGTLISNALFISKLVIPDQQSTSDTCDTINEEDLFEYCDSEDLMVLGWIHTHPSQTCFMSSRDLHTHAGYQVMMPEAIAIVCAPSKNPSWGIFRLTNPPGLSTILSCRQQGIFHPHEGNIYTSALRPGHVSEAPGLNFQVFDLRPGRSRK